MDPDGLRQLLTQAIEAQIDSRALETMLQTQKSERGVLEIFPSVMFNDVVYPEIMSALGRRGKQLARQAHSRKW
jgi:hypothetical protein